MDQLIINREYIEDESYNISSDKFISGHTYRVAIASVDHNNNENWTEVEFTVIDNNEYDLSGYIKDKKTKAGISDAEVTLNDSMSVTTNSKGYYQIKALAGDYVVSVSKEGFADYNININLFEDKNKNFSIDKSLTTAPTVTAEAIRNNQINLKWNIVNGAAIYNIYRASSKNGKYSLIGPATTNSFVDSGLKAEKTYWYKVTACNNVGDRVQSKVVSATTPKTTINQPRASKWGTITIVTGNVTWISGFDFIKSVITEKVHGTSSVNVNIDGMARLIYKELGYITFEDQASMKKTIIDKITSKVGVTGLQQFVFDTNKILENEWAFINDSLEIERSKYDKYCEDERRYFQVIKTGDNAMILNLSYGVIDKYTPISGLGKDSAMNATKYRIKIYKEGDWFPTWESDITTTCDVNKYATATLTEPGNYYVVVNRDISETFLPATIKWDCIITSSSLLQNIVWPN